MTEAASRPAAPAPASPAAATAADEPAPAAPPAGEADRALVSRLLAGDEASFTHLVDTLHGRAVRFAEALLHDTALAEDAVQETWLAVIANLRQWEGRSSLRTWIYSILVNQARKAARRKGRSLSMSDLGSPAEDPGESFGADVGRVPWSASKDRPVGEGLDERARLEVLEAAVNALPDIQRAVLVLNDIEQLDGDSICNVLGLSRINRRVILHRARVRVREALKARFGEP